MARPKGAMPNFQADEANLGSGRAGSVACVRSPTYEKVTAYPATAGSEPAARKAAARYERLRVETASKPVPGSSLAGLASTMAPVGCGPIGGVVAVPARSIRAGLCARSGTRIS